jgi:hypothetical protein
MSEPLDLYNVQMMFEFMISKGIIDIEEFEKFKKDCEAVGSIN